MLLDKIRRILPVLGGGASLRRGRLAAARMAGRSRHWTSTVLLFCMVVILGVISGTFLPVYLLPKPLQYLSLISPIRWGIDNYLVIFIREGTILSILPNILLLLLFFIFAMIFSITIFARNK